MTDSKNRLVAILLAFFLGGLGFHKFYLNKNFQGVLYILFCWTFIPSILALFDFLVLICTSDARFNELYNSN